MKTSAIFTIFLLFSTTIAIAEEQAKQEAQKPLLRRKATSKVRRLTDMIDDLFGTQRRDENRQFSTLRLSGRYAILDGSPSETSYNMRLMLRPATFQNWSAQANRWMKRKKGKVRNFIRPKQTESFTVEKSEEKDNSELIERTEIEEDENASDEPGIRDPWRPAFEQRYRLERNNFFDGRLKTTKDIEWGNFLHHLVFDVRWSMPRQWESALSIVSSYSLTDCLLFQFGNSFNWLLTARDFESNLGPSLAYTISPNKAISLSFTAAVGTAPWWVNAFTITSVYRQHIFEDWIDISISPYQSYPRLQNFRAETGIVFNAEAVF